MYLADALSRAFPPEVTQEQFEDDIDTERFIHLMSSESYVADRKLQAIQSEIRSDATMQLLQAQIQSDWPEHKSLIPADLHPYTTNTDNARRTNLQSSQRTDSSQAT